VLSSNCYDERGQGALPMNILFKCAWESGEREDGNRIAAPHSFQLCVVAELCVVRRKCDAFMRLCSQIRMNDTASAFNWPFVDLGHQDLSPPCIGFGVGKLAYLTRPVAGGCVGPSRSVLLFPKSNHYLSKPCRKRKGGVEARSLPI
jgi:hypothetical protein